MPQKMPEHCTMKARIMQAAAQRGCLLLLLLAFLGALSAACARSNDAPPFPDTEEPPAHRGCFASEYGSLCFHGDGAHLTAELLLPDGRRLNGDMYYSFQWGSYGSCRYDIASHLMLTDEVSGDRLCEFQLRSADEESIALNYFADDALYEFTLKKQKEER